MRSETSSSFPPAAPWSAEAAEAAARAALDLCGSFEAWPTLLAHLAPTAAALERWLAAGPEARRDPAPLRAALARLLP